MAFRLSRFLNLERARPKADADPRSSLTEDRFRPEPDGQPTPDPAAFHELEALRLARMQRLASGVELAERSDEEQPFCRCALCEMDNNRAARRCQNCGTDLATDLQREFNARLWARHREEIAREQGEVAHLYGQHEPGAAQDATGTRAYGEALARSVAQLEKARLSSWSGAGEGYAWQPPGVRLLNGVPTVFGKLVAAAATLGLAILLGSLALEERRTTFRLGVAQILFIVLVALFVPRRRRRRSFFDWFDRS